jgi:hypothetical protein
MRLMLVTAAGVGLEGRASSPSPSCLATVPLFRASFVLTVIDLDSEGDVVDQLVGSFFADEVVFDGVFQAFIESGYESGLALVREARGELSELGGVLAGRSCLFEVEDLAFGAALFVDIAESRSESFFEFVDAAKDGLDLVRDVVLVLAGVLAYVGFEPDEGIAPEVGRGVGDAFSPVLELAVVGFLVHAELGEEGLQSARLPVEGLRREGLDRASPSALELKDGGLELLILLLELYEYGLVVGRAVALAGGRMRGHRGCVSIAR